MMAILCYIMFEYEHELYSWFRIQSRTLACVQMLSNTPNSWSLTMSTLKVAVLSLHVFSSLSSQQKCARLGIQLAITLVLFPPTSGAICQLPLYPPPPLYCSYPTHSTPQTLLYLGLDHHAGYESHGTVPGTAMGKSQGGPFPKKQRLLGWYSATQKINKCLLKRDHFTRIFFEFHRPTIGP